VEIIAEAQQALADGRPGSIWDLARKDRDCSLAVQQSIEIVASEMQRATERQDTAAYERAVYDTWAVLGDLQGYVMDALQHPHANHVIKQIVTCMPTDCIGFVAAELIGKGAWAAKHKYGCRVVLRLIQHCGNGGPASECAESVINEVMDNAAELSIDAFGKFVIEELLQSGVKEYQRRVAAVIHPRIIKIARHKHGSGIIEKLLKFCDQDICTDIVNELIAKAETVVSLSRNQSACMFSWPLCVHATATRRFKMQFKM